MRRYLSALILGTVLMTPIAMRADDHHDKRYYDRDRRDYHAWNEAEARAYRHWLEEERHMKYHEWNRSNARERAEYWRWRHEHSDWH
ncbi:MAG TPA: hypothetical protein VGH38_35345 [Bryobacteraceae bacterium]|jgi:type III secretory pathway component EscR